MAKPKSEFVMRRRKGEWVQIKRTHVEMMKRWRKKKKKKAEKEAEAAFKADPLALKLFE
jgi:hypothetical protein